jgi:hypothetical protein
MPRSGEALLFPAGRVAKRKKQKKKKSKKKKQKMGERKKCMLLFLS